MKKKNTWKIWRKWTALALSVFLCADLSVAVMASGREETGEEAEASGTAAGEDGESSADGTSRSASEKEEVVYVRLAADGTPLNTYVVNIFPGGEITDYGSYSSVKILNTTDEITIKNDVVTFSSSAHRVYYQGELEDAELPWNISIRYFLDGEEYAPDELAGAEGALEIRFDVAENEDCTGSFYDTYALQASFTLDTDLCSDIQAEGATIANAGSDKQLTYTILPGAGISAVITANVTDFEMDAVSVNGIRMSLDIDIDDDELMEQVTELKGAIGEIDDGTGEAEAGVGELRENAADGLQDGAEELDDGAGALQTGAGALVSGGAEVSSGAAALTSGANTLDDGMQSLNSGIEQVQAGLDALSEQSDALTGGSAQMKAALQQLQAALSGVSASADEIQELLSASSALKQGISDLSDGAAALQSSISYEAYKTAMAAYGLDIDTLLAGNEAGASTIGDTIAQLQALRDAMSGYESILSMIGLSADTIDQYIALLEQTETLLNGNTAAIQGMENYLGAANAGAAELAAAAEQLSGSYEAFDAAVGSLADTLADLLYKTTELKEAVNTLVEEYAALDGGLSAYTEGVVRIAAGYDSITDGAANLASGSSGLVSGSSSLSSGTTALLNSMTELYGASGMLKAGTGELKAGAAELLTGVDALYDGIGELKEGTAELREETSDLDSRVEEEINGILEGISGGDAAVVSFVSEKNAEVSSVQFVIRTEAIEVAEAEPAAEPEEELTFWQRILRLFGLY